MVEHLTVDQEAAGSTPVIHPPQAAIPAAFSISNPIPLLQHQYHRLSMTYRILSVI